MKEYRDTCEKGILEKSAIAEHTWENHHHIRWEEASVVDRARRPKELLKGPSTHPYDHCIGALQP